MSAHVSQLSKAALATPSLTLLAVTKRWSIANSKPSTPSKPKSATRIASPLCIASTTSQLACAATQRACLFLLMQRPLNVIAPLLSCAKCCESRLVRSKTIDASSQSHSTICTLRVTRPKTLRTCSLSSWRMPHSIHHLEQQLMSQERETWPLATTQSRFSIAAPVLMPLSFQTSTAS